MNRFSIRTMADWSKAFEWLKQIALEPIPKNGLEVIVRRTQRRRTLDQNALSHVWYAEVAEKEGEYTPEQIKRRCKYHLGIPILRQDEEFSQMIEPILSGLPDWTVVDRNNEPLRYKAMDLISVSSVMGTKQMTAYMEAIQAHYSGRVQLEAA